MLCLGLRKQGTLGVPAPIGGGVPMLLLALAHCQTAGQQEKILSILGPSQHFGPISSFGLFGAYFCH